MTRAVSEAEVEAAARHDADFDGRPFDRLGRDDKDRYLERARGSLTAALAAIPAQQEPVVSGGDAVSREAGLSLLRNMRAENDREGEFAPRMAALYEAKREAYGAAIDMLTGLRALPAASQWRAMDSAPKDGSWILARLKGWIKVPLQIVWWDATPGVGLWKDAHAYLYGTGELDAWMPPPPVLPSVEKGTKP